jgi:Zn-dependent peptidase ImmA (M78 family)/transcriptional regulator with XRE-family HTH domain
MPISQKELGQRLRVAREACGMTQEEVARGLKLSRPTIAQMELGNRAVSSIELDRLAYLFGRDIREFLADDFQDKDAFGALFRAHPEMTAQPKVANALRTCLALGREITNLERMLSIDRDIGTTAAYPLPPPRNKWDAVQQGVRVAEEERRRLQLGISPLANVAEVLETQGVRTAQINLPDDVSGLTLSEPSVGLFVVANSGHHLLRRRYSYAHEYAHVLLDRERLGTISRAANRDDLIEVRANAFAANLLLPEEGIRQFTAALGKGVASRQQMDVFDEGGVVHAAFRVEPRSQDMQLYDVVQLAHHFGVSRLAALYQLRNLRLLTEGELTHLKQQEEAGRGKVVAEVLDLPEPDHETARNEFCHRFLALGLEALRRGEITRRKLEEIARMVEVSPDQVTRLVQDVSIDDEYGEGDVVIPKV